MSDKIDYGAIVAQLKDKVNDMQVRHLKVQDHLMATVKIVVAQKEEIVIAHETNDATKRRVSQMDDVLIDIKKENKELKESVISIHSRCDRLGENQSTTFQNEERIKEINSLLRVIVNDPIYAKKQWHAKLDQAKFDIMREL